jgi:hypothetical protein
MIHSTSAEFRGVVVVVDVKNTPTNANLPSFGLSKEAKQ